MRQDRSADVSETKRKRESGDTGPMNHYETESARGASHIASMLYEQSIRAADRETLLQSEACHGREALEGYASALLARLEQRAKPQEVRVLRDLIDHGRLAEQRLTVRKK